MKEYIEREAALRPFIIDKDGRRIPEVDGDNFPVTIEIKEVKRILRALPAADVKPIVHGKWTIEQINTYQLSYGTTAYEPVYRCSACGQSTESYLRLDEPIMPEDADFPKFCPNCGADMREVDNG